MFIYSLPIFFSQTGLVSPLELLIILLGLFVVLFYTAPLPEKPFPTMNAQNYLFATWTGQASVNLAFWPFFVLLNICLYSIDTLAKSGGFTVSSWDEAHLTLLFPIIWWTCSIWRCSLYSHNRFWSGLYRLATLSVFFEYAIKLMIRIDYPRVFFDCSEAMLDYGSCF